MAKNLNGGENQRVRMHEECCCIVVYLHLLLALTAPSWCVKMTWSNAPDAGVNLSSIGHSQVARYNLGVLHHDLSEGRGKVFR